MKKHPSSYQQVDGPSKLGASRSVSSKQALVVRNRFATLAASIAMGAILLLLAAPERAVAAAPDPVDNLSLTVQQLPGGNVRYTLDGAWRNTSGSERTPGSFYNSTTGTPPSNFGPGFTTFDLPPGLLFQGTEVYHQGGGEANRIYFADWSGLPFWYLGVNTSYSVAPGELVTASGSVVTDAVPFSLFVPGTFEIPAHGRPYSFTYFVIPLGPDMGPAPSGGHGRRSRPSFLVVDSGAIASTSTAPLVANAARQTVQNAASTVTRDLNDRLFRNRAGITPGDSGALIEVIPEGDSAKESFEEQVRAEANAAHRGFEVFTQFDYGNYNQSRLTDSIRGFETDTFAGTLGAELRPAPGVTAGLAWSYFDSSAKLDQNLGSVDVDGHLFSGYVGARHGGLWADLLYSYGTMDVETRRNTLIGPRVRGATDASLHAAAFNAGYSHELTPSVTAGPYLGLGYSHGKMDGYTESGSARANLIYDDDSFDSLIGRLGMALTHAANVADGARLTTQLRAAWGHEFKPDRGNTSATLSNSPFTLVSGTRARPVSGYRIEVEDAHPGSSWLELGGGVRLDLRGGLNLALDYDGIYARSNAREHLVTVRVGFEW